MKIRVCKKCQKIFAPKTEKQEFCSDDCKYNYFNVYYNCDKCGQQFLTKKTMIDRLNSGRRKHLYCPSCTNDGNGSTDVTNTCVICGKSFKVTKAFSDQKYCSKKCSSIGAIQYDNIECLICGKSFRPKSSTTLFCSNECKFEFYKNRVECFCDYCGKKIDKKLSDYNKNSKNYCSKVCHYLDIAWSEHDKNILRQYYNKIDKEEILKMLDQPYTTKALSSEAGRLGLYDDSRFWTKEEENVLFANYSNIPMNQVLLLLPNRTKSSILGKARQCGILSYHYLTNCYSDDEETFLRNNYLSMTNEELADTLHRTANGIAQHLWILKLKRPKEIHNYDTLANYVRSRITVWKNKVKSDNGWTCSLTGSHSNIVLHHCRSFNLLLLEALDDLDFQIKNDLDDYTQQELDDFVEYFLYLQDYYGEYCCITEDVHKLFHRQYGYGNNTMEQWNEFSIDFKNGKYQNVA